jgi:cobalt ECF transporter T component CbiQ
VASLGKAIAREFAGAERPESWLATIDARVKIVGVFALIVGATLLHTLWGLAATLATAALLAASIRPGSGPGPGRRLARVWLGAPLFSLAIILPAALDIVTPGRPVLTIWRFDHPIPFGPWTLPQTLAFTGAGLAVAGRFLMRTTACVTFAYLLVATTEPTALIDGIRRLGMPRTFGMVLTVAHRYLIVLLRAAEEIHLAKLSRTISSGPIRAEQRWVAAGMGMLFRRTHRLAQEVQNAMISRGFDGELRVKPGPRLSARDYLWAAGAFAVTAGLFVFDRLIAGGLH